MSCPSTRAGRKPSLCELIQQRVVLALPPAHDRGQHEKPRALFECHQTVDDLLGALAGDGRPHFGQCGIPIRA